MTDVSRIEELEGELHQEKLKVSQLSNGIEELNAICVNRGAIIDDLRKTLIKRNQFIAKELFPCQS